MSSGPFTATPPARSTITRRPASPGGSLAPAARRVAVRCVRAILVTMLLVATLVVATLATALSAIVAILATPWLIYRLRFSPAPDRSPSGTGALLDARPGRGDDAAFAAPSGT